MKNEKGNGEKKMKNEKGSGEKCRKEVEMYWDVKKGILQKSNDVNTNRKNAAIIFLYTNT